MTRFSPRYICILLIFSLLGCAGGFGGTQGQSARSVSSAGLAKTRPDPVPERRIVLLHPESGESLDLVYFRNGHYDTGALRKIDHLFRDRHANVAGKIDPELIDYLVDIRKRLGLPSSVTFEILSGYRTAKTNAQLARHNHNVATESLHIHGWAVDFRIASVDGRAIREIAKTMQRGGVAYYPEDNHLHVDLGNIRTWHGKK